MLPESSPTDWAHRLRRNWDRRARSAERDFYIASHRGCDDPDTWEAQARFDAAICLHDLSAQELAGMDVLEVGCGIGRLARQVAPRVRTYTGIDISAEMRAAAEQACADLPDTRFLLGDGLTLPEPARDRAYDLAFAHAVLVHCPREVIARLLASTYRALAPGAEFRFQLRAEQSDREGIEPTTTDLLDVSPPALPTGELTRDEARAIEAIQTDTRGHYYMGHAFRFAEVAPFLREVLPGVTLRLRRFEPELHHVAVVRTVESARGSRPRASRSRSH